MDELTRATRLTFAPDRRLTALTAAAAAVAVVTAILVPDAPGRLLAAVAAIVLAAYVVTDLLFTPRLVATSQALTVRTPAVRTTLAWAEVERVRADSRTRLGLRSAALEIDAGETLVVLTRRALGARPDDAADLINALRPA